MPTISPNMVVVIAWPTPWLSTLELMLPLSLSKPKKAVIMPMTVPSSPSIGATLLMSAR